MNRFINDQDRASADYMIRRALALLLSDLRGWKRELRSVHFGLSNIPTASALEGPYLRDLILLFNLWKASQSFCRELLENVDIPQSWYREPDVVNPAELQGPIDWPRTLQQRQKGKDVFVVQRTKRRFADQEALFMAMVVTEFTMHCQIITNHVIQSMDGIVPPYVAGMLEDIDGARTKAEEFLGQESLSPCRGRCKDLSEKIEETLREILEAKEVLPEQIFLKYQSVIQLRPPRATLLASAVKEFAKAREQYLACEVWLTDESVFKYVREGSMADLYEVWCFFEFAAAIRRIGVEEIIQLRYIRRGQSEAQFRLGPDAYVFFDNRSGTFRGVDDSHMLSANIDFKGAIPEVYVEWLILNINDFRQSICIDAKYANWESREMLKVSGYMQNYGIENGVLIIRDRVRQGEEVVPGLYRIKFPLGGTLWLIQLNPTYESEEMNVDVLVRFAELVFSKNE